MVNKRDYNFSNKGVTTNLESDLSNSESCNKLQYPKRSISWVKKDLEAVIDLMGPDTPQFNQTSSDIEVENEETYSVMYNKLEDSKEFTNCEMEMDDSLNKTTCTEVLPRDDQTSAMAEPATTFTDYSTVTEPCPPPMFASRCNYGCYCPGNNKICIRPQMESNMVCPAHSVPIVSHRKLHGPVKRYGGKYKTRKKNIYNWMRCVMGKVQEPSDCSLESDYYKINVKQSAMNHVPPKKLVFELVDKSSKKRPDEPIIIKCDNPRCRNISPDRVKDMKNMNNEKMILREVFCKDGVQRTVKDASGIMDHDLINTSLPRKTTTFDYEGTTRVDVYYFDHGDAKYLQTVDRSPLAATELLAEKTENYTTKFWAEVFGTIHIGFSFCTSFFLQFCRFITVSLVRPLTVGLVQVVSDYFLKPLLATVFNAVIQPPLIFLYNTATSVRDLLQPLAEAIGYFIREIAVVFRSFRFVEVRQDRSQTDTNSKCESRNCENRKIPTR